MKLSILKVFTKKEKGVRITEKQKQMIIILLTNKTKNKLNDNMTFDQYIIEFMD